MARRFLVAKTAKPLGVLRDLDDRLEARGILNRDLAEHLAVEHDAGLGETRDELRVADTLGAGGGVDAGDPKLLSHSDIRNIINTKYSRLCRQQQ